MNCERETETAALFNSSSRRSLILGGLAFSLLTGAIFWYQFYRIQPGEDFPRLSQLRWGYLILILLFIPLETFILALRMWVVGRVLQPGISFWTCFKADLASSGIALLTPAQTGGGPGQIYFLNRGGARLGTALSVSLLAFFGTMIALLGCGLYCLFISEIGRTGLLFKGASVMLILITASVIFFAWCPAFFRAGIGCGSRLIWRIRGRRCALQDWWPPGDPRTGSPVDCMDSFSGGLADVVYNYRSDLRRYLKRGKLSFTAVCLLSLGFLLSRFFLAYFSIRFLGIEVSTIGEILETQMALIFLTYLAPTPGSAGIAEGASLWVMGEIVPMGFAPYYNLMWRFSTVYIAAIAGLILLLQGILIDLRISLRQRPASSRPQRPG